MRSSKVLYLCSFNLNRLSGTPIRADITIREMARRLPVRVISFGEYPVSNIKLKGVWASLPGTKRKFGHLRFLSQALFHLIQERPAVIHTFSSIGMLAAHWYRQLNPHVKLIFEMHGVMEYELKYASLPAYRLYCWLDRQAVSNADHILAMSTRHKQFLVDTYQVPASKIEVSWGPVDLELFSYRPPMNRNLLVVGYAGGDSFWQGMETIREAAYRLVGYPLHFRLVGFDPEAYRTQYPDNVELGGIIQRQAMPDVLGSCDVLLSTRIGGPVTNLQYPFKLSAYLAVGRPVIVTDVSDQRLIVESADCGCVIPPNDVSALTEALREFSRISYDERVRLGKNARCFAESHLSLSVFGDRLQEIYDIG